VRFNFTDRVRLALAEARNEAERLRHVQVGPEHILLGVVHDRGSLAVQMLHELGLDPGMLRERALSRLEPGQATRRPFFRGEISYAAAARLVLDRSAEAARELNHHYVGTEHLLLGLLSAGDPLAAGTLVDLGVTEPAARSALESLLASRGAGSFRIALDDASATSIHEQIVAQVQEAVATGRLRPGERLPTVRQLADDLDIAPGTVARAYAELERLGVLRTDGARGTRVAERTPAAPAGAASPETLIGLLRPVAVAAFHLGATAEQLRSALEAAMRDIFLAPPAS